MNICPEPGNALPNERCRRWSAAALLTLIAFALCLVPVRADAAADPPKRKPVVDIPFEGQVNAPEFPEGIEWLNTARPLSLKDLRGKVVLLDFWTYCCINCMHIIPDLKKLEAKYPRELVVIGVHSAKFTNEKDTANIREAIKRYEIEHPVINDKDFQVWRGYSVRAWPTLMLLNPQGRVVGGQSGEGIYDLFDQIIGETVRYFDEKGLIDRKPINLQLEKDKAPRSVLSYPGKISADDKSKRLFFTDSNHNRVVVTTLDGEILESIGDGEIGLKDGSFERARFFRPQGICFDPANEQLFVADTENHAIRQIDLQKRFVETLAGTGQQARSFNKEGKGVDLNSPWDVVLIEDALYIAMAGSHQLWSLDLKTNAAKVYAGSGRENIVDASLKDCALAQPSGITTDGKKLYFADSEVSAVRMADLDPKGKVETLIGEGLFEFGDIDGKYPQARLQHCLGVTYYDGFIYIADTYNHKVKKLNPKTKELVTFLGTGKRGMAEGAGKTAMFNEPSGLCVADGKLFIADANNHVIRVCDLKTGHVSTLQLKNLEKLARARGPTQTPNTVKIKPHTISANAQSLELKLSLPRGTKLNLNGRSTVRLESADAGILKFSQAEVDVKKETVTVSVAAKPGKTKATLQVALYYCDETNAGLCYFKDVSLAVPIEVIPAGDKLFAVEYAVK